MRKQNIKLDGKNITWLEFELLSNKIFHTITTRNEGYSSDNFESLNLSYDVGDERDCVQKNFQLVKNAFHLPKIVYAKQVHETNIVFVDQNSPEEINNCDALMTNIPGIALMIRHADCQAAIFYDPINKAIANVHSGWKGNAQNIYAKTVETMKKNFNSQAKDLIVCISPSLGPTAAEFNNFDELPSYFTAFQVKTNHLDLWAIAKKQLQDAGILEKNIEIASICTYNSPKDFFSFRRNNTTGRNTTIVML